MPSQLVKLVVIVVVIVVITAVVVITVVFPLCLLFLSFELSVTKVDLPLIK